VRERLLCQPLPPPPPGVNVQPPPLDPSKTTRERYAAHSSIEPCSTCHRLMDPIGLSFEHFDGIGRYRADDNGHPIDVNGEILSSPHSDGTFVGTDQLIDKLEASQDTHDCYALQWYRFVYGFSEPTNRCLASRFQQAIAQGDGSLTAILSMLTGSDSFLGREAPSAADSVGPPPTEAAPVPASGMPAADPRAALPDAGATAVPPELEVTLSVDNDFGTGYCHTYELHNRGSMPITWSVPLDVSGKMNNHWECQVTGDTGSVVFSGEDYNRTLQPDGKAQFGFCAQR
jgi:cellulase/cellobiase CelA1